MKTSEQRRLVRYAEAMGWKPYVFGGQFPQPPGTYCIVPLRASQEGPPPFRIVRGDYITTNGWNPLTDANDALELAEKMDVEFARRGSSCYWAHWRKDGQHDGSVRADTLPAAIGAAVDAALGKMKP